MALLHKIIKILIFLGIFVPIDVFSVSTPSFDISEIQTQRESVNLTDSSAADRKPIVIVKGDTIHLVWGDENNSDVLYKRSTNMGTTWGSTITVGDDSFYSLSTRPIAMDAVGSKVYIAWATSNSGSANGIKFSKSVDGGATFSSPVNIAAGERPSISADGNNVNIIGWGYTGNDKIKFVRSTDNGATFSDAVIAGDGGIVNAIDSSSNEIYIVSRTGASTMNLIKSSNGGTTFSSSSIDTCNDFPGIMKTSNYLHYTCGYGDVRYKISDDLGATWSTVGTVTSNWAPTAPQYVNGTNHHMVWRHDGISGGHGQIYHATSSDGVTFNKVNQVSGLGINYNNQEASIGVNGTNVAIAFTGCASSICDIFIATSTDSGVSFTTSGASQQAKHVIATNSNQSYLNATKVSTNTVTIYNTTPTTDFTIITPNLNGTLTASTTPTDLSHAEITIKNSTRSINTSTNPNASVVGTIQELGYTNGTTIKFDKMVKLQLFGDTGSTPFFINSTDTYLISQCSGSPSTSTQAASDSTITGGKRECYWTANNGTKFIWTYHFTAFGTGNNFGSSSSSSSSSSGGSGSPSKKYCDSSAFGLGKSIRVYQVSYDIQTNQVDVIAYSSCGAAIAKVSSGADLQILSLTSEQPYIEQKKIVYSGKINPDNKKFTVILKNDRDSFTETFYIRDSSILKEYGITGYTSEQQGMTFGEINTETIPDKNIESLESSESTDNIQSELENNVESVIQEITESPDPEPQVEKTCQEGTMLENGICVPMNRSESSGCLIATASYGTELAPQVQLLREIRDSSLYQTSSGTAFMTGFNEFYYTFSPTVSDWERQSPLFKEVVKLTITPMLSTLSILNYADIHSEQQMLGYGIGIILLNAGIYFGIPAVVIFAIRKKF